MTRVVVALTAAAVAAWLGGPSLAAQSARAPGPDAPVPRTADGRPDFTGVWWPGQDITPETSTAVWRPDQLEGVQFPPGTFGSLYQPWALEKAKTLSDKDDPALHCIPSISPNPIVGNGMVGEFIQTPKLIILLVETYHTFRLIPTDGRPHRDDVVPSFHGDSVGRWEGDTLVVDVTNFSDRNWMEHHGRVSFHSDALHIIERYRLINGNTIEVDMTAEDPRVLTGPYKRKSMLVRAPFEHVMETSCENVQTAGLIEAAAKDNYGRKK